MPTYCPPGAKVNRGPRSAHPTVDWTPTPAVSLLGKWTCCTPFEPIPALLQVTAHLSGYVAK